MEQNMITLAPGDMSGRETSRLLTSVVVPRPIAWVSTCGDNGALNLAPFSYFNGVSSSPPIVMIAVSARSERHGGGIKDTLRNAQQTGELVINLLDETLVQAMNLTSGEYPPDVDEFTVAGVTPAASIDVLPPRVAEAPIALETKVQQIVPVEGTNSSLILSRVVRYHIREGLLRPDGTVDPALLRPVARLGGSEYASISGVFNLTRPEVVQK